MGLDTNEKMWSNSLLPVAVPLPAVFLEHLSLRKCPKYTRVRLGSLDYRSTVSGL